jgi:hypothetical protein
MDRTADERERAAVVDSTSVCTSGVGDRILANRLVVFQDNLMQGQLSGVTDAAALGGFTRRPAVGQGQVAHDDRCARGDTEHARSVVTTDDQCDRARTARVRFLSMKSSPLVNATIAGDAKAKSMVSPGTASAIACRSEPAPRTAVLVTVTVAARTRAGREHVMIRESRVTRRRRLSKEKGNRKRCGNLGAFTGTSQCLHEMIMSLPVTGAPKARLLLDREGQLAA